MIDMNGIANGSPIPTRGGTYTFFSFPAWLILNAQKPRLSNRPCRNSESPSLVARHPGMDDD